MRKLVEPGSAASAILAEEQALLRRVLAFLHGTSEPRGGGGDHDAELIELRDAIAEAKPEDVAPLVEQMMRVSAVAAGRRGKVRSPVDLSSPYFGHMRLRQGDRPPQDILIGRHGLIDREGRQAGVQIVDWRDAPISQIYYRYEEGDDYEENISGSQLSGLVEVRRNVTILGGRLRRVGCPQGSFISDGEGRFHEVDAKDAPALAGGQGLSARAPRAPERRGKGRRAQLGAKGPGFVERADKHLPEIAALIDPEQFALITEPDAGLIIIQGGAGSGKTTVALHRVAYLAFHDPQRFRSSRMLVIVPSVALARYVSGVLPGLQVTGVPVLQCAAWMRTHRRRLLPHLPDRRNDPGETPEAVARAKKHPRMLRVIDDYIRDQAAALRATLQGALQADAGPVLSEWDRHADLPLRPRCQAVRRALPRLALPRPDLLHRAEETLKRLSRRAHDVGRDWAELLTDHGRLSTGLCGGADGVPEGEITALIEWCKAQQEEVEPLPEDVDPERYEAVDGRPLDEDSPAGRLDLEDDPLLLRLYQRKHGGLTREGGAPLAYEHLVLDEAQDLSVVEMKVLLDCVSGGDRRSVTIAGDVAQRLVFDNGFRGWEELLQALSVTSARMRHLQILYRSTRQVMELAHKVLGPMGRRLVATDQRVTREGARVAAFRFVEVGEAVAFLAEALRSLVSREPSASVALVARHAGTADTYYQALRRAEVPSLRRVARHEFPFTPGIDVTDVTQVKGLEFDYVVILDATAAAYPDSVEARHLLHIAITRCAHQLWLIAPGHPSPLVPPEYFAEEAGFFAGHDGEELETASG